MRKILVCAALVAIAGCATKTRSVELSGMYVSEAGTLAIGNVDVMASPVGEESAFIKYDEDVAWLSPSQKTHDIKIMLTGTNSIDKVDAIVSSICAAFASNAVVLASSECRTNGVTAMDVIKFAAEKSVSAVSSKKDSSGSCTDGTCAPAATECADGTCAPKEGK